MASDTLAAGLTFRSTPAESQPDLGHAITFGRINVTG